MPNGSGSAVESQNLLSTPAQWALALLYRSCPRKAMQFFEHVRPSLQFLMPLFLLMWAIERWILPSSSFLLVAFVVWATLQYGNFQHQILAEELKKKWIHLLLNTTPTTPLESCQWLNKLLVQVWPNVVAPKLSKHFSAVLQKHIRIRKPKLVRRIKLQEFSLGSCTPILGMHRTHWTTAGGQQVLHMDFEWKTNNMCIMLDTKLAMPFLGTKQILINSIHIKGDLCVLPILDGQAILYSFETTPELSIGIAFGSGATGGDQELPTSKLPGVSAWLVKFLTDLLVKTMVEPRRRCYPLPLTSDKRTVVGGTVSITVISVSNLLRANIKRQKASQSHGSAELDGSSDGSANDGLHTFVEVELGDISQRTDVKQGSNPNWNASFEMVLPESSSTLHVHLYEWSPTNMKLDCLTSCEIKMTHVADDSIIFWAVGSESSAIVKHAECFGKEVEMVVPFDGTESVEVTIKLALKRWLFADGSNNLEKSTLSSEMTTGGSKQLSPTGRKFKITIIEGRNLASVGRPGMSSTYVKLQYGKVLYQTRTLSHAVDPIWNQSFEFNDIGGGEYLKVTCYSSDIFGDDSVGSAKINFEGLTEDSTKDIWIPLERVNTGELRIRIEQVKDGDIEDSQSKNEGRVAGVIELVLIEAKSLIAADLSGTSDPYVKILYGNTHRKSKVQEVVKKFHVLVDNEDLDGISMALNEIQQVEEEQEKYMLQLEREKNLLLSKISELAKEINHAVLASPTLQL
ncbi:synaptotagmin-5 isoform X2 [Nymphaea colorata]|uniref:synaptotagmin-5 isoform X2 n=1 Tax=Nymphaea colorata TaxID=210225 RepID=UPI00214EE3AC|nr:synaptotagmin-5 isoform X2 [Nymphaea colorata]